MQDPTPEKNGSRQWKFLFVNTNEEDTRFLTKNLPVQVIHAKRLETVEQTIKQHPVNGIFVDMASASPEKISELKKTHDGAVVMLADVADLPKAIEHVRQGDAHGFVVKGVSNSDSVLKLVEFVSKQSQPRN